MNRNIFVPVYALVFLSCSQAVESIRVACIGDSITAGMGVLHPSQDAYPAQLGRLLGEPWEVRNFGVNSPTLMRAGDKPYDKLPENAAAQRWKPDVVVLALGSNDSKDINIGQHPDDFVPSLKKLISDYRTANPLAKIFVCLPPPVFPDYGTITETAMQQKIRPLLRTVINEEKLPLIDLHTPLIGKGNLFPDKIHPNPEGSGEIAQIVCNSVMMTAKSQLAAPENLALHCGYTSSDPNPHGWDKPGLTDGVWGTEPLTCYASNNSPVFPKTVTVDLGSRKSFSTVVVEVPPFGSTKTVEISVSTDSASFIPFGSYVFKQGDAQRAAVTKSKTSARYVRLTYPDHYSEERGFSANFVFTSELEVYDGSAPVVSPPALLAVTPAVKNQERHKEFLYRVTEGPVGLLLLGDSITDFWPRTGEFSWLKFAPYQPADFGIGGDRTEHLLWRITNGELEGIQPKVVMIMIGTNNVDRDEPEAAAAGVTAIVKTVRQKLSESKILLLAIFPRERSDSLRRRKNSAVNAIISKLDDEENVSYLDIGSVFLDSRGEIPDEIMNDSVHPTAKGYDRWFQAIHPKLEALMHSASM